MFNNIAIIGSSGAIGNALVRHLSKLYPQASIYAFSHSETNTMGFSKKTSVFHIDYTREASLANSANIAAKKHKLDLVLVATGILHSSSITPEKSLKALSAEQFQSLFMANTIFPALVAKHFIPKMETKSRAVFAALSARVGSISDNKLGGWYAYRASKAALNMVIKNLSIEVARYNSKVIIVGLHPGTVDSALSKPYQSNLAPAKLFTAEFSASKLIEVLVNLTTSESGCCVAWDGKVIKP